MIKSNLSNLAIVGSGPTAIYLLRYIWTHIDVLKNELKKITIFEKEMLLGMGMPYHPNTTDIYNLANISSEEIPLLQETFGNWLRQQNSETLRKLNISNKPIDDAEVYSRISLGQYFHDQFKQLLIALKSAGIEIEELHISEVLDISQSNENELIITDSKHNTYAFSTVVIANGHEWKGEDNPKAGYYASPWPIHKILPKEGELYNFSVGTLGASLSAFDVVTSLSHRHGQFVTVDNQLIFIKDKNAPHFKIVLHSSRGWLPHLQYEQQEPIREIYRHFNRNQLLELIDDNGFLRIEDYFDNLCRAALIAAFNKDKMNDVVVKLQQDNFSFKDLVEFMSEKHEYVNSFEGMKKEMITAKNSVYNKIPINWMETLDDLMYSLNYHAELLAAEDHAFFHKEIMSFLMNVIAALPLQSAKILLALYDAGAIELKSGMVSFKDDAFDNNRTRIAIESETGDIEEMEYRLFINCGGHKRLELEDYPFQSLVKKGLVRCATARFEEPNIAYNSSEKCDPNLIIKNDNKSNLKLSGIDIDASYRTINNKGISNPFLYDLNFTHTSGLRPYSYGLQACSATSLIVVESWISQIVEYKDISNDIEKITELYEDTDGL
ncbi:hypothetical protein LCGC14_0470950 [marine sediment metagenome]|uniref:FAD-dependent urate hydroxylase HpyO/Asp monooxygenase CreE-like FAD/NAD(P)-binding domain-containing protein n=1 Tax=marine sediment metagenome TaxID=412755 RepID=A0A0F9SC97_9ZZZZ|nr:hypothetical protein [Methylophaga sp.]HEC58868.1 hypothetical protein [Methylophaga sp.]